MLSKLTRIAFAAALMASPLPVRADYVGAQPGGGLITVGAFATTINGVVTQLTKSVQVDPLTGLAINPATEGKLEAVRALLAGTLNFGLPPGAASDAKLEAIRLSLAAPLLPLGAATDAKLEAVRALLAAPLSIGLPNGAATDAKLEAVRALLAAPLSVTPTVAGFANVAVASFIRPANTTAYTAGQLVANSTTAGSVAPMQFTVARTAAGTGLIRRARLTKSGTTTLYATFDLLLYKPTGVAACPVSAAGDGAAYSTDSALLYLGRIPVSMDQVFTDGAKGIGVPATGSEIVFDTLAGSQILCGFVRATGGYTPVSGETFTAALEVLPN